MVTQKTDGFTLVELVVVILIIAVLVSVAAPQYKLAVARVRYLTLQRTVRQIMDAEQRYFQANGDFAGDLSLLDLKFPPWKEMRVWADESREGGLYIGAEGEEIILQKIPDYLEIIMHSPKVPVGFSMYDWHYPDMIHNPDVKKSHLIESYCVGNRNDLESTRQMCKSFGAQVGIWPGGSDWSWKF